MFSSYSVTRFKNNLVAVFFATPASYAHTRRGAPRAFFLTAYARWLPFHRAAANTVAPCGRGSWHVVAARGPHGERSSRPAGCASQLPGPGCEVADCTPSAPSVHSAPSDTGTRREVRARAKDAAACDYSAAGDHENPFRGRSIRKGNKRARKRMWTWAIRAPLGSTRRRCAVLTQLEVLTSRAVVLTLERRLGDTLA